MTWKKELEHHMKVSKRAYAALAKSVKHWERLNNCSTSEELLQEGVRSTNCELCKIYAIDKLTYNKCKYCPIKKHTGQEQCHETPYYNVIDVFTRDLDVYPVTLAVDMNFRLIKLCVEKELEFLKDLLSICEIK